MPTIKIDLGTRSPMRDYFEGVSARLVDLGVPRAELARELGMDKGQLGRLFTSDRPNPTAETLMAIEEAIVVLRRMKSEREILAREELEYALKRKR